MSGISLWVVQASHPTSEGWEQREVELYLRAGRRTDCPPESGGGRRELCWFCDSLDSARGMREALAVVGGVSVVAREPIDGR